MAEKAQQSSGVRLAVGYPHDRFEHGVSGVQPLTTEFSEPLSDAKVKEVRKVARQHDVPLRQSSSDSDQEEAGS